MSARCPTCGRQATGATQKQATRTAILQAMRGMPPSDATAIGRRAGYVAETVRDHLASLEREGVVERRHRRTGWVLVAAEGAVS